MGCVYILFCIDRSYYVGSTNNLLSRLNIHKSGGVKYTKNRRPLTLVFVKEFKTYSEARSFELKVKSWKKRLSIEKMLNKPDNTVTKYL